MKTSWLSGSVRLGVRHDDGTYQELVPFHKNLEMYAWASVALRRSFIADSDPFRVCALYIEYENVAMPGDTVSIPSLTRADGIDYYNNLTLPGDFIRIDTRFAQISSTDEVKYPDGNLMQVQGQSGGTTGVNGSAFAYASNSKIYGTALAAIRDPNDRTQDIVVARYYYTGAEQIIKPLSGQVDVTWQVVVDLDA